MYCSTVADIRRASAAHMASPPLADLSRLPRLHSVVLSDEMETNEWKQLLEAPPASAVELRQTLLARADTLSESVPCLAAKLEVDIVLSGCGFMVLYYLGVHSVLSRLEARGCAKLHRFAGASSGAKCPAQLILAGEALTMDHHLAYGELCERRGGSSIHAACRNDRCARVTTDYLIAHYSRRLLDLDQRLFVCISQLTLLGPRRIVNSAFCDDKQPRVMQRVREALHATGTLLTRLEGRGWYSDGANSGNSAASLSTAFGDSPRDQLYCEPQRCGLPKSMIFAYSVQQAVDAVRTGQDEIMALLESLAAGVEPPAGGALSLVRRAAAR